MRARSAQVAHTRRPVWRFRCTLSLCFRHVLQRPPGSRRRDPGRRAAIPVRLPDAIENSSTAPCIRLTYTDTRVARGLAGMKRPHGCQTTLCVRKSVDRARRRSPLRTPRRLTGLGLLPVSVTWQGIGHGVRTRHRRPGRALRGRPPALARPQDGAVCLLQRGRCGGPPRMDLSVRRLHPRNYAVRRPSAVERSAGRGWRPRSSHGPQEGTRARFPRPIRYSGRVRGGGKDRKSLQSCPEPMTLCTDARIDAAVTIPQSYLLANWTARALL
jgi:hypothetical protein